MTPQFSIITTCKGRLRDLKLSLPTFLAQDGAEVIVVDYDCPDGTSAYVARQHPDVRLVTISDRPKFNVSHARNLGAAEARGEFLVFLDADILVVGHFLAHLGGVMKKGSFAIFDPHAENSVRGSCVVDRRLFEEIGRYDEVIEGYGGEDIDLYARLRLVKAGRILLPVTLVERVLEQTSEERERFRDPDIKKQFLRGMLYVLAKEMVASLQKSPQVDTAFQKKLFQAVDRQLGPLWRGEKAFQLQINLPDRFKRQYLADWEFSRSVVVRAKRKDVK